MSWFGSLLTCSPDTYIIQDVMVLAFRDGTDYGFERWSQGVPISCEAEGDNVRLVPPSFLILRNLRHVVGKILPRKVFLILEFSSKQTVGTTGGHD